jgi:hypothetical protein
VDIGQTGAPDLPLLNDGLDDIDDVRHCI